MGHEKTNGGRATRAISGICATAILLCAFASSAQALPSHARKANLDVTGLNHACGTAVDSKGDFYASSAGEAKVNVYDPSHNLLTSIPDTHEPCGLAVGAYGEVLVSEKATGNVVAFGPNAYPFSGTPTYSAAVPIVSSGNAKGISIDRVDNRLYVAEGTSVSTYTSEVQSVNVNNATGGTYKLRFKGEETAAIPFNASNSEIQTALTGLAAIGAGGVSVSTQGSAKRIAFVGALAYTEVPQIEAIGSLTGNATKRVTVSATSGTYKLRFEGEETAPVGFEASAAEVQVALAALAGIGAGNVAVTGGPGDSGGTKPYLVTFQGALAAKAVGQMESETAALGGNAAVASLSDGANILVSTSTSGGLGTDEVQKLGLENARGGTYKLKFENEETAAIAFNAPARKGEGAGSVEAALEGLLKIGPGDVSVVKSNAGILVTRAFAVSFEGVYRAKDVPQLELVSSLTGNETQRVAVKATSGTYKLAQITARGRGKITTGSKEVTGVSASLGAFHVGDAIGGEGGIPPGTTIAAVGAGTLELSAAATATFDVVSFAATETTAAIAYNAEAAEVQTALAALAAIGAGNVSVTGGPGDEKGTKPYFVTFQGALAATHVEQMESDASGLSGTLSVTTTVFGLITSVSTSIVGGITAVGEGTLSEATGVASYTYRSFIGNERYLWVADAAGGGPDRLYLFGGLAEIKSLKLRRELSGAGTPDGSLGFGAAGAYLAADPGNREAAGEKCVAVGEQACTAGHLFLYDAEHKALDEFDASGEYLDQTKSGAFADAEPSAIAIDRSGGANDGTIYITAGAGADGKALAYGPLGAPSRKILKEPSEEAGGLSHKVSGVVNVATDSHGYVYVLAGAEIHVYKPDGSGLGKIVINGGQEEEKGLFEDPNNPGSLAVDSTGKVYVDDFGKHNEASESEVTYYTPSAYPPTATTTYVRQEPAPVTGLNFRGITVQLSAIALNPGPGPGKDHLFVDDGEFIHEYDSAANGSTLLNGAFGAGVLNQGNRPVLAVDGRNGHVFLASNSQPIQVSNAQGTEVLARNIRAGGPFAPGLTLPSKIAVDQSNGHLLEYDDKNIGAREYDAAGSFVAEFGVFTKNLNRNDFGVAVDSACAIHVPPLDETTTPTCHQYDPADGTFYVAVHDTNPNHPPYDVNAFGPLSYPQVGEPPAATSGVADEFGPGAATLHGTVNPKRSLLERCEFEYLPASKYEENTKAHPGDEEAAFAGAESKACAESLAQIGEGNEAVAVHAEVEGLAVVPYRFRLLTRNGGGAGAGKAVLFGPPVVSGKQALPILYHEATLRAQIDPSGLATEYRFEYLDRQSYEEQGSFEGPATQHTDLGELALGEAPVAVSAAVLGLTEGTEYLFRAVAKNAYARVAGSAGAFVTQVRRGAESCPNAIYRFGLSANLPDCRAYELVTPAETSGLIPRAIDDNASAGANVGFSNWLTPQRGEGAGERLSYFTGGTLPGFEGNGIGDGYRAERGVGDHPPGGWQSALFSPDYRESAPGIHSSPRPYGLAADQLYSVWETNPGPETSPQTLPHGLYLRTPAGFEALGRGSLGTDLAAKSQYVSDGGAHVIFTSAKQLEPGTAGGGVYDRAAGAASAELVSVKPDGSTFGGGATYIGASEDGAAVAFSVSGVLYLHRVGKTTEVATSPNTFAGISADGRRVFYAATATGNSPAALYSCDTAAGPCAGTGAHLPTKIAAAGIFALVSPDGSHAFFSSTEALSGGEENENGEHAEAGKRNLYAWDGSATSFVGRLAAADFENFAGIVGMNLAAWTSAIGRGGGSGRAYAPTRSSTGGGAFAFQSHARLTAYDNEGAGEIYRYEPTAAAGERLLCISCDPSGAPPTADALFEDLRPLTPVFGLTAIANLSEDGREVFFQSPDRLLPEDANEVEDVYEWKANGTGGCTRPGGCLALISSGQGEVSSYLYAMSADGRDVFFQTKEKLVGLDVPGSPSIYDARVGGGIPEPAPPAPCQGDACQGVGALPPNLAAPASTGGGEAGEASPPDRCAKGKHRVKGRCVAAKHHKNKKRHRRAKHKRRAQR